MVIKMFLRIETDKAAIRAGMIEIINGTEATVAEKLEAAKIIAEMGL